MVAAAAFAMVSRNECLRIGQPCPAEPPRGQSYSRRLPAKWRPVASKVLTVIPAVRVKFDSSRLSCVNDRCMDAEEREICDFLKSWVDQYVSQREICRRAGGKWRF